MSTVTAAMITAKETLELLAFDDPFPPPGRFPGSVRHARQALGGMRSAQDL